MELKYANEMFLGGKIPENESVNNYFKYLKPKYRFLKNIYSILEKYESINDKEIEAIYLNRLSKVINEVGTD